jgi:Flp pilus assembly pilin Flp
MERFWKSELGQDLSEWCLITALVSLIALGIFFQFSGGMQNLWGNANAALANGNTAAGAAAGTSSTASSSPPTTPGH